MIRILGNTSRFPLAMEIRRMQDDVVPCLERRKKMHFSLDRSYVVTNTGSPQDAMCLFSRRGKWSAWRNRKGPGPRHQKPNQSTYVQIKSLHG